VVRRVLANIDWERFDVYSHYVRKLENLGSTLISGSLSLALEGSLLSRLRSGGEGAVPDGVLPNLKHLTWLLRHNEDIRAISRLLTPKLTCLYLYLLDSQDSNLSTSIPHLIDAIHLISPSIADFALIPSAQSSSRAWTKEQFVSIIQAQNQLHTLRITVTDLIDNYKNLPVLPNLAVLSFCENQFTQNQPPRSLTADGCARVASLIPAVRTINGIAFQSTLSFCINVFPFIGPRISEVALLVIKPISSSLIRQLITVTGETCPNLTVFMIRDTTFSDEGMVDLTSVFRPLLACPSIRCLELSVSRHPRWDFSLAITDTDVKAMASAWPGLERFLLNVNNLNGNAVLPNPTLTLDAVNTLCGLCPRLRKVIMTLDATVRPASLEPHGNGFGFPKSALEMLNVAKSTISDPFHVALWLGDICSADKLVIPRWRDEDEGTILGGRYERWRKAREYLQGMQDVRKAEKEKAEGVIRHLEAENSALKAGGGHPVMP
jgi:hypothetical protein